MIAVLASRSPWLELGVMTAALACACGSSADNGQPPAGLTHVGAAAWQALDELDDPVSNLTSDSYTEGDWLIENPDTSRTPWGTSAEIGDNGGGVLFRRIAAEIEATERSLSWSTAVIELDVLERHFAPALVALHDRGLSPPPAIRLVFGAPGATPAEVYDALTTELRTIEPDEDRWNLALSVVQMGNPLLLLSWNHSKLVIRDGLLVISGGQNLERQYQADYPSEDEPAPRYDVSMEVRGEAVAASQAFYEQVWQRAGRTDGQGLEEPEADVCSATFFGGDCHATPEPAQSVPGTGVARPVFVLGRGPFSEEGDFSADAALVAALGAARRRIHIHQQTLDNPSVPGEQYPGALFDLLADRLEAEPELELKITVGADTTPVDEYCALIAHLLEDGREPLVERVEMAPFAPAGDGQARSVHHKIALIDDSFYIGSQNFYPTSLRSGDPILDAVTLAEHGFLIDHPPTTAEAVQLLFEPIWQYSAPQRFTRSDCPF